MNAMNRKHLGAHGGTPDATEEDEDVLDLPVNPDESIPLIPDDDDRVVNVPS